MEKVKLSYRGKIYDGKVYIDKHFFGGKKVVFKNENGTKSYISIELIKIIDNN